MIMLNNKIYQMIYDELFKYLPISWERLIVYLEYGEDSYSYSFYVKENGEYTKCFDMENVSEDMLYSSFAKIERMVSAERCKQNDGLWSNMTMIVESIGRMKTDFDYTDLSAGNYQYKKNWKKKYLK